MAAVFLRRPIVQTLLVLLAASSAAAPQTTTPVRSARQGSETAREGFRNETRIAGKFNNWRTDAEARIWLTSMGYRVDEIESVSATKPHGEKADILVEVKTGRAAGREGISIKLVSSEQGFNQIDKRWLAHYAKMWTMPIAVVDALRLFVGETPPTKAGRAVNRMFLNELDPTAKNAIVEFFQTNRPRVVADLFRGDGVYAAGWIMVAQTSGEKPRWVLRKIDDAIRFYADGPVAVTRGGNLKIGRITMQRKGGDAGRDTAKMLQFKIDPTDLFDLK
jgi:hypothetical protein